MRTVKEIESAISKLSRDELQNFREWFLGFDAAAWDKQFEQDVKAARLDALADEALHGLLKHRASKSSGVSSRKHQTPCRRKFSIHKTGRTAPFAAFQESRLFLVG